MHFVFSQENSAILMELVELRSQKSALLGFSTHADFVLEMNMSKASKKVAAFLGRDAQWIVFPNHDCISAAILAKDNEVR